MYSYAQKHKKYFFGLIVFLILGLGIILLTKDSDVNDQAAILDNLPYAIKELSEPFVIPDIPQNFGVSEVGTYRNERFGFEFQYPLQLSNEVVEAQEVLTYLDENRLVSEDDPVITKFCHGGYCFSVNFSIRKASPDVLYNVRLLLQGATGIPIKHISHIETQHLKINNRPALRVLLYPKGSTPEEKALQEEYFFFMKDGRLYTYFFFHRNTNAQPLKEYFLNTFRFIER